MKHKNRSLRTEIIGPLLILSVIGFIAIFWIVLASIQTQHTITKASQTALHSVQVAYDTEIAVEQLGKLIGQAMHMVAVEDVEKVSLELNATITKLRKLIDRQYKFSENTEATELAEQLRTDVESLIKDSKVFVSSIHSPQIPTHHSIEERIRHVNLLSTKLAAVADNNSVEINKMAQNEFLWMLVQVTTIMTALFIAGVLFALNRSNKIVSALQDLSNTMVRIRNNDFPEAIEACTRSDEIGTMAQNVAAFAVGLKKLTSAKARIEHIAHHDTLTGLPNRRSFQEQVVRHFRMNKSSGVPFAVFILDLDNFKAINDSLGHPVGDALLCKATERLLQSVDDTHFVARLGGDEFAIIISDARQPDRTEELAERLNDFLSRPFLINGSVINVTTSMGIALAPDDGDNFKEILQKADLALYRSKMRGRNTHTFYDESLNANVLSRRSIEIDLRKVLARNELELHYQPLVSTKTGNVVALEALCRWNHPERGIINPTEFILVAEEIGLISEIGEWVLKTACKEATRWPDSIRMAVNLSPVQFQKGNVVSTVKTALEEAKLAPKRLELEITERVFLERNIQNINTLRSLKALGVRIALDDFGTGYSSLSYIREFPFDKVKIDRSFISGIPNNEQSSAIVSAIITLGMSLGVTTTAEGVETEIQREFLTHEGCDELQGFLISKPLPPEQLREFTQNSRAVA